MMPNFVDLLQDVHGTSFVAIDVETTVALQGGKANPMKGRVTKRARGHNVAVFENKYVNGYENMVRRRLKGEGKDPDGFELGPRKWGTRLKGMPLVHHQKDGQDKYYLEVIFVRSGTVEYLLDGQPIDKNQIQGMPPEHEEAEQGGLEDKVIIRTFALDSIQRIRINNAEHNGPFFVKL
jgi:hypothetical protein